MMSFSINSHTQCNCSECDCQIYLPKSTGKEFLCVLCKKGNHSMKEEFSK